jgi:hypothetical protein
MNPTARRQVELHGVFAGIEHRRYHELGAHHELIVQAVHLGVVRVVNERMPNHG